MTLGDSKTDVINNGNVWPDEVSRGITAANLDYSPTQLCNDGVSGSTVSQWASTFSSKVSTCTAGSGNVRYLLINLGVNDITGGLPNQTTWQSDYLSIIDQIHTKWPSAHVYVTKPWKQGYDADCDTLAASIDTIVAARSSFTSVGDDERVWFKPNVATYSPDGVHYNAAGEEAARAVKLTVLGY